MINNCLPFYFLFIFHAGPFCFILNGAFFWLVGSHEGIIPDQLFPTFSWLLDEIIPKMEQVFLKIIEDGPEAFDIERINNFIDRKSFAKLKDDINFWNYKQLSDKTKSFFLSL